MPSTAIQVEHLSKLYRLGVINNGALYQDIQTWIAIKRGKEDPHSKIGENKYSGDKDHFWALKDVSFDVKQGDRLGIIGKNGAGKSTLLKILSRITAPTEGTVRIKGKVASLLEVGTGFHGELTGRENIYLNGAILGMKKRRIDEKLDSIIEFSGIEYHIDTPVKRYSSGMYVRLAFAVAAHLDSDILIADEVLAVGDAEFQKKALGKMQDLSTGEGRTVLFVSHNMAAVKNLCKCGILLEEGKIRKQDSINPLVDEYLNSLSSVLTKNDLKTNDQKLRRGSDSMRFSSVSFSKDKYYTSENIYLSFSVETLVPLNKLYFCLLLKNSDSSPLTEIYHNLVDTKIAAGYKASFELEISKEALRPGKYPTYLWLGDEQALHLSVPARHYEVLDEFLRPLHIIPSDDEKNSALYECISRGGIAIPSKLKAI
jgi:lipopolysaccharide transport system ATP-binding protein